MRARWRNIAGTAVACLLLSGCLGIEKRNASVDDSGDTTTTLVTGGAVPAASVLQDYQYSFAPTGVADGVTFTAKNLPGWLTLDAATGAVSGLADAPGSYSAIKIIAHKGADQQSIGPFTITVNGDPLLDEAWEFENTQQYTFSAIPAAAGVDARIRAANRLGFLGRGVRVMVSDSGVQTGHEDLLANVGTGSRDYGPGSSAPYTGVPTAYLPTNPDEEDYDTAAHGTGVAGIIAAVGWNNKGSRGVAPMATLVGSNFISYFDHSSHEIDQITDSQAAVFNQSWGYTASKYTQIDAPYLSAVVSTVLNNRAGKGATLVRSAGNEWGHLAPNHAGIDNGVNDSNLPEAFYRAPLPCTVDGLNSHPYQVVVGASNALGFSSSYSSPGACIWITSPGGEYGPSIGSDPTDLRASAATISTDIMGCSEGFSRASIYFTSPFDSGGSGNTSCNYTSIFNGTSSAAPHTSGVVALMLEANPDLNWRDVKHILAKTAPKIDDNPYDYRIDHTLICDHHDANGAVDFQFIDCGPPGHTCPAEPTTFTHCDPSGHINQPGWAVNGAGYHFHYWYGFGGLNALAATQMAKTFTPNSLGTLLQTAWGADSGTISSSNLIPNNSATGLSKTLSVSQNYTIEAVQVAVFITHDYNGDVGVELTSPAGTKSVLIHTNNGMGNTQNIGNLTLLSDPDPSKGGAILLTNAFYGEHSQGTWTLKVFDGYGNHAGNAASYGASGTLNRWAINVFGHTPLTPEP